MEQAARANHSKSDLAYVLTFAGGVELFLVGHEESNWYHGLDELAEWYQSGQVMTCRLASAAEELIGQLSEDWPEAFAAVCQFGAKKYARGNYLKGRGWHDTCNSLLRHIRAVERGEVVDPESGCPHEGHIAWNIMFLVHCVRTMPQFDDRVKAAPIATAA